MLSKHCQECGKPFQARRSDRRYCTSACKAKANRRPKARARPAEWTAGPIAEAAEDALARAGRASTWEGLAALKLARAMDSAGPDQPAAAVASMSRELAAAMARALRDAAAPSDVARIEAAGKDEVRRARERKAGRGRGRAGAAGAPAGE